jgi:sarcosine oxidase subunit beta
VSSSRGTFAAECLLNAAGAWGAQISAQFGEDVPISAKAPQMGVTEPLPYRILPVVGIWTRAKSLNAYLRQVSRGNIVFGGGVEQIPMSLDPGYAHADPASLNVQIPALARLVPGIRNIAIIRTWSGCEGYVSDMLPIIGPSETTPGLFHAFGFSGHGFQIGPGVGDVMAELISTGKSSTPIEDFRIGRFPASRAVH